MRRFRVAMPPEVAPPAKTDSSEGCGERVSSESTPPWLKLTRESIPGYGPTSTVKAGLFCPGMP